MSVSLSAEIITATASVVIAQAPALALEGAGGISWDWIQSIIAKNLSVIIAGVALFIAIFQAYTMQKHSQLSVKPLLNTSGQQDFDASFTKVFFKLSNVGVGPAIIKRLVMFINSSEYVIDSPQAAEKFNSQILKSGFAGLRFNALIPGAALATGESIEIFAGQIINKRTDDMLPFKCLGIRIDYQSIYQNKTFVYKEPNLLIPKPKGEKHD